MDLSGSGKDAAREALHEIMRAETRKAAQQGIARFVADYEAKYPKAVASLQRDEAELLAFFDFPAEPWLHLRTGNVIESPCATVRLRQRVTKGAGSRQKGLLMAFQLLVMAERRWRRINAPRARARRARRGRASGRHGRRARGGAQAA